MSIWSAIESEFNAIVADARSVPEKLAALVDLHGKAQGLAGIETTIMTIIEDTTKVTDEKVTAILQAVGKL